MSLRGGCFCNPGCVEAALGFDAELARACRATLGDGYTDPTFSACLRGPVGAVRASLGIPTIAEDLERLIDVLAGSRGQRVA